MVTIQQPAGLLNCCFGRGGKKIAKCQGIWGRNLDKRVIITWAGTEPGHWSKISSLFGFASTIKSSWIGTLVFYYTWKRGVLPEQWHCWWATIWANSPKMFPCRTLSLTPPPAQICLALRDARDLFFWTSNCWFSGKPEFFQVQNSKYNKLHICFCVERCSPNPLETGRAHSALLLSSINPHI